jgi:hypothetical protein
MVEGQKWKDHRKIFDYRIRVSTICGPNKEPLLTVGGEGGSLITVSTYQ